MIKTNLKWQCPIHPHSEGHVWSNKTHRDWKNKFSKVSVATECLLYKTQKNVYDIKIPVGTGFQKQNIIGL